MNLDLSLKLPKLDVSAWNLGLAAGALAIASAGLISCSGGGGARNCSTDEDCDSGECVEHVCTDDDDDYNYDDYNYDYDYDYDEDCFGDCCYGECDDDDDYDHDYDECYSDLDCPGGYDCDDNACWPSGECGTTDFSRSITLPAGAEAEGVALAFIDADGDVSEDLIVLGRQSLQVVNFADDTIIEVAAPLYVGPVSIATGDFNGDGFQDFVTADVNTQELRTFLGDGERFRSPSAASVALRNVVAFDYNHDGLLDVAGIGTGAAIQFLRGDGSGGFVEADAIEVAATHLTAGPLVSSLGEGAIAYVVDGRPRIHNGEFQLANPVGVDVSDGELSIADFNGDGYADLVGAGPNASELLLWRGHDSGIDYVERYETQHDQASRIASGDVDGDGYRDALTLGERGLEVSYGGAEVFQCTGTWELYGQTIVVGDANGDGRKDIAVLYYGELFIVAGAEREN